MRKGAGTLPGKEPWFDESAAENLVAHAQGRVMSCFSLQRKNTAQVCREIYLRLQTPHEDRHKLKNPNRFFLLFYIHRNNLVTLSLKIPAVFTQVRIFLFLSYVAGCL